jgi:uncharacterized protein
MPEIATQTLALSRYIVESDLITVTDSGQSYYVVFSTRSGEVVSIHASAWLRVKSGHFEQLSVTTRDLLLNAGILVPSGFDEFSQVVRENISETEANETLYQVVQPTAWCQLGCNYCGQEHSHRQLPEVEQNKLIERICRRLAGNNYRQLKLGWFGGEPLAGLAVIRALSAKAMKAAQQYHCDYTARIITNGVMLSPEIANELYTTCHVHEAEITLDGIARDHDSRRHTKKGKKTFQHIFDNILKIAQATPMQIVIRCNVDRFNADGVSILIESLSAAGLSQRISFYTSPVYSWGNDAHERALSKEEYGLLEIEWIALQIRLGFQVGVIPTRRKIVCMAVQHDAEVVDAYGNLFNCTEVPYVSSYGQPNMYANGITDINPQLSQASQKLRHFNEQLLRQEHESCAQCVMLPVCGGHCPKAWHEGNPPCPSAKQNMPQRLNLLFALSRLAQ